MSADIDYVYLLMPLKFVLQTPNIQFEADNNKCPHFKRSKVYFNIFTKAIKENNRDLFFNTFGKLLTKEEEKFCDMFLYTFLDVMDEELFMEDIFEKKETMDNQTFLSFSTAASEVRKFKTYMKENPSCCCSH